MMYQEFLTKIAENKELEKNFSEKLKQMSPDEIDPAGYCENIAKELGFDVPANEFKLMELATQDLEMGELSLEELDQVAGGKGCYVVFTHPSDTKKGDKCFNNYDCRMVNMHGDMNMVNEIKDVPKNIKKAIDFFTS